MTLLEQMKKMIPPIKSKTVDTVIMDDLQIDEPSADQKKLEEAVEKMKDLEGNIKVAGFGSHSIPLPDNKSKYLMIKGHEKYTALAAGLRLDPRGVIVGGTDPGRILAVSWQLRNLARAAKKKGTLVAPFVGLVLLDECTLPDMKRVLRGICKDHLPMGICTRDRAVLHQADRIFPKEIPRIALLWIGPKTAAVGVSSRFDVSFATTSFLHIADE